MQYRSVIKSVAIVGSFVLISRIFGLVRDIFFARYFGTSMAKSAFDVAFRIPNLFRRLFGEGALSASFIPVFTETLEKQGRDQAWDLVDRVRTILVVVLSAVTVAGIVAITVCLNSGDMSEKASLTLGLLRIMLPYMFFICLVAFCMGILNSFHHFVLPAATPVVLNIVLIVAMIWVCPLFGETQELRIHGAAWAVLAAGILQLAIQIPMLFRYGCCPRVSWRWRDERVRKILLLMLPASVGMGITQINVLVGSLLAMWVGEWAPAALSYAEHMVYLPLGIFATALGTVLLPVFSRHAARSREDEIRSTINRSLRHLMFVMIPAAVGLVVLAHPLIRLIFERGSFTEESTFLTARALQFYAPGLFAFSMYKIFAPAFYALKDTATPVKVGICAIALNFALNVAGVLVFPLYYKHAAIALGSVIAESANGAVLAWLLHKRIGSPGWRRIFASLGLILLCSCLMGVAVWFAFPLLEQAGACLFPLSESAPVAGAGWSRSAHVARTAAQAVAVLGSVCLGGLVFALLAAALCRTEFAEIGSVLRRGPRRTDSAGTPRAL